MKKKFYFNLDNKKFLEQKIWSKIYIKQIKRFSPKKNIQIIDNHSEINTIFSSDNKKGFSIFFNNTEMLKIDTSKTLFFKTFLPMGIIKSRKSAEILSKNYKLCFTNHDKTFFIKKKVKAGFNTHVGVFQAFLPGSQARGVILWMRKKNKKKFKFYLKFYLFLIILQLKTQCNVKVFSYNLKKFLTKIIFFHVSKLISKDIKNNKKILLLKHRFFKRRKRLLYFRKDPQRWWENIILKFEKLESKELEELKEEIKQKQTKRLENLEIKLSKSLKTKKEQYEELEQIKSKMREKLNNKKVLKKKLKRRKKSKKDNIPKIGWKLKYFERRRIRRIFRKRKRKIWKRRAVRCLFIPYEKLVSILITPAHQKKNFVKRYYRWYTRSNFVIIHNIEIARQRELVKKRGFTY